MKTCTQCGETKEYSAFAINRTQRDRRNPYCKACRRKWYLKTNVARLEYAKKYRQEHRGRILQYMAQWHSGNLEHELSYRQENAEKIAQYRLDHPEMMRSSRKLWKNKNPDSLRLQEQVRRFRKRGSATDFRVGDWEDTLFIFDYRCAYCGRTGIKLTQDHVIPLARGGGHTISNVVPACHRCNCAKHTRLPQDFRPMPTAR